MPASKGKIKKADAPAEDGDDFDNGKSPFDGLFDDVFGTNFTTRTKLTPRAKSFISKKARKDKKKAHKAKMIKRQEEQGLTVQ